MRVQHRSHREKQTVETENSIKYRLADTLPRSKRAPLCDSVFITSHQRCFRSHSELAGYICSLFQRLNETANTVTVQGSVCGSLGADTSLVVAVSQWVANYLGARECMYENQIGSCLPAMATGLNGL